MNVVFIYPDVFGRVRFNHDIAFVSGALKEAGHHTALIYSCEKSEGPSTDEEILTHVAAAKAGMVVFWASPGEYEACEYIASKVKHAFAHIPILIGGPDAAARADEVLSLRVFDYVCGAAAQEAVCELASAIDIGAPVISIAGISGLSGGEVFRNEARSLEPAAAASPDYGLFDIQAILDAHGGEFPILTSRPKALPRQLRVREEQAWPTWHRDVDTVVGEAAGIVATYERVGSFAIEDADFTGDWEHAEAFCRRFSRVVGVPFTCKAAPVSLDARKAAVLSSCGCVSVEIEIAHPGDGDSRSIKNAAAAVRGAGMKVSTFIAGLPVEVSAGNLAPLDLVAGLKPRKFRWDACAPRPGSRPPAHGCSRFTAAYPWYVNALSEDEVVRRLYSRLTRVLDGLVDDALEEFGPEIPRLDGLLHQVLAKAERSHYFLGEDGLSAAVFQ